MIFKERTFILGNVFEFVEKLCQILLNTRHEFSCQALTITHG